MRSYLFVPGDSERKLAKVLAAGADAVIIDLEDGVSAERKSAARELARGFLAEAIATAPRPRLVVRINDLTTTLWEDDLAAVVQATPDALMLPKARSGEDVRQLSRALKHVERSAGIEPGSIRLIALATEVPSSLLAMGSYANASSRLDGLAWGAEDLSASIGAARTHDQSGRLATPFRLARDLCLLAAADAGCQAIDGVHTELGDADGLRAVCLEASLDGFTGKLAIHPGQVAVINAAFTPSAEEVGQAREILRAFDTDPAAGVISFAGRMLDRPHRLRAERTLARAGLAGTRSE